MEEIWQINIFGGLRAQRGEDVILSYRTQKIEALLARLAYLNGQSAHREELIDMLWPDCTLKEGRNRLNVELSWLRKRLAIPNIPGAEIITGTTGVALNPEYVCTDITCFEKLIKQSSPQSKMAPDNAGSPVERGCMLAQAFELYRGHLLPRFEQDWIESAREWRAAQYDDLVEQLVVHHLRSGEKERAVEYAGRAVRIDRFREKPNCLLLRSLVDCGKPSEAQRHYKEWSRLLEKEYQEEPPLIATKIAEEATRLLANGDSSATQLSRPTDFSSQKPAAVDNSANSPVDKNDTISQLEPAGKDKAGTGESSLPPVFTHIVGRESELSEIQHYLLEQDTRLLTILGAGGTGKTRLAIELARNIVPSFAGSAWFVPLADFHGAGGVTEAIRSVLKLPDNESDALDQIVASLANKPALLVLDNFDHLVDEAATLVRVLLSRLPLLKCLVTSRQCLSLSMEQEYELQPLSLPELEDSKSFLQQAEQLAANPSIQLFIQRARKVRPDFGLTEQNGKAIVEICTRLAGIPLAIELAAAWAKMLAPAEILKQLPKLLVSQSRDVEESHRSLDAVIGASYNRLSPELKSFFGRLSVFRGGWTIEAAEAISVETSALELLSHLREATMIVAEERGNSARFRMLEPIREYAVLRLHKSGEDRAALEAHAKYYLALAKVAGDGIKGKDQAEWFRCLDLELLNIRHSLTTASRPAVVEAVVSLQNFLIARGLAREGRKIVEEALTELENIPLKVQASGFHSSGILAWMCGDFDSARLHLSVCLALCRADNDEQGIMKALGNLASISSQLGEFQKARIELESSLEIARRLNNPISIASILNNLGTLCAQETEYSTARKFLGEALILVTDLGDELFRADILHNFADSYSCEGAYNEALHNIYESLRIRRIIGDKGRMPQAILLIAVIAVNLKKHITALKLFAAVRVEQESSGISMTNIENEKVEAKILETKGQVSLDVFNSAWKEGTVMKLEDSVTHALNQMENWLHDSRKGAY